MAVFTVTAGHSDVDPGAVSSYSNEESVAQEARNMLAAALRERGHTVRTDGDEDTNQSLNQAIRLIPGSAAAVELHCNAGPSSATGVETIALPKDRQLAMALSRALSEALGLRLRGRDRDGWIDQSDSARGRLGYINAGGLIVELFFLSNPSDCAAWEAYQDDAIEALADVLDDHAARRAGR